MHSGIVFYEDILKTYEVFNLELRADLVALSACETGLGKLRPGEGMIGLSRAFMYAGAPSVLVSLWKVSDEATSLLMTGFYRNLLSGLSKAQALRQAKIDLINREHNTLVSGATDRSHENPFFWAPFVLIGSWQ